jgi:WD40 repeat protein
MDLWEQPFDRDGAAAGSPRPLTAGIGMRGAALSSDGRRLVYSIGRRIGNVYRVPFRADKPATWADAEQLTFDQASVQCFDLDRSGTRLAVSSDRSGSFDLWTMPAAGGNLLQLTSDPSAEWCPAWSPDGGNLAFYAYRSGNRDVWTMPSGGGEWKRITTNEGPDLHPSWMFDGTKLGYLSRRDGNGGMWLSPLDGGADTFLGAFGGGGRLSPVDRRLVTQSVDGATTVEYLDGRQPSIQVKVQSAGMRSWSLDGRQLIIRSAADQISSIDARQGATARVVVNLSGRRGTLGVYGTPSDGKFIYFIWEENLGDIWTMTLASTAQR